MGAPWHYPEGQREHLFDRFYQAESRRYPVGMGLGLYISKQVVEEHGGNLTAEFPPDGGSRFIVVLPVSPDGMTSPQP